MRSVSQQNWAVMAIGLHDLARVDDPEGMKTSRARHLLSEDG